MRIVLLAIVLLLSACGMTDKPVENVQQAFQEKEVISEVSNEIFTLKLISEKLNYKVGEELQIRAELTYKGEEPITIGHGGSWIHLATTNLTKDYQFGSAMIEPYITTPIPPGETIIQQYKFSGGTYYDGAPGAKYSEEEFKEMGDMNFPVGEYKIEGLTDFHIDGEGNNIKLKTEVIFHVIE